MAYEGTGEQTSLGMEKEAQGRYAPIGYEFDRIAKCGSQPAGINQAKQPEVIMVLESGKKTHAFLQATVDQLHGRLEMVMIPSPQPEAYGTTRRGLEAPLFDQLESLFSSIAEEARRIEHMMQRLAL